MKGAFKYSQVALIALSLTACGGGGGGGGGGPSAPVTTTPNVPGVLPGSISRPVQPISQPITPPPNNNQSTPPNNGNNGGLNNTGGNTQPPSNNGGSNNNSSGNSQPINPPTNSSNSGTGGGNTTQPNNQGGAITPPSGGNTNPAPPNSNQITPQPPQNLPTPKNVENLRTNLTDTANDENKIMKISVIDTDFSDKGDTFNAFNYDDGTSRLRLNVGTNYQAKGSNKSHGTMAAGVIASYNKTSPIYGYTTDNTQSNVIAQNIHFEAAYNNGARIFNNSWGGNVEENNYANEQVWRNRLGATPTDQFVGQKAASDSIFVFAVGNEGVDHPKRAHYASTQSHYPVVYPNAKRGFIAVTSVNWGNNSLMPYANKLGPLAKFWGIASHGEHSLFNHQADTQGTSFAAPVVSAAAANVWEKFPWMSNHLVVQSILSTANQLGSTNVTTGPRDDVGWGVLNQTRALKGPARFDKRLLTDDEPNHVVADFNYRNYKEKDRLTFSNDITGDAGFKKKGTGILYFTGSNSYTGDTIIEGGRLQIENALTSSKVTINQNGTLTAQNESKKVTIGNNNGYTLTNNGSLEVFGKGLTINGNYTATQNSRTAIDINTAQLNVTGTADMGNSRILAHINNIQQIPTSGSHEKIILTAKTLQNYNNYYTISDYINPYIKIDELKTENNQVKVKFTRNSSQYVARAIAFSTTSSLNTANNLDVALNEVASNSSSPLATNALSIITATPFALTKTLQTLSAEIYASSQNALLNQNHQISQKMATRAFSDESGFYSSYDYNRYEISKQGFASGDTKSYLTSVGVDERVDDFKFGVNLNRGQIKSEFTNLAGNSKITTNGVNLYAKAGFSDFYTLFGTGITWIENSVKRNLIIANDSSQINVKQKGKIYNIYAEAGYRFGFFTPFLAYELNMFRQNGIDEGQNFGIKSDRTSNDISSYLSGVRANFNAQNFSFNAALTYIYTPDADFDFKAKFVGGNSDITIKGINANKNQLGLNFGVGYSFTPSFGVFSSYAFNTSKDAKSQNLNVSARYKF
ncbi:S8 family serine peptidase [Campylobacter mucosalis]|uniref:Putative autotransporter serine protease n=1 Tax=Campylobacter mucosalis CCUG 21559 TaxID=1032067 RepID=A0A6G5QJ60_9BACT|nr:S8 family serine peptidase [Campylobacter mucosalis]QCD45691.1 putative autotransporter serine protease [Campylobacter mucosalis CCUG 21559]